MGDGRVAAAGAPAVADAVPLEPLAIAKSCPMTSGRRPEARREEKRGPVPLPVEEAGVLAAPVPVVVLACRGGARREEAPDPMPLL